MPGLMLKLLALLLWLGLGSATLAATGTALGVDPDARAETKAATRVLTVGADVFIGDRIVTDAKGLVQIRFSDTTKLVVGPNSALVLQDYLLREDGSAGKMAVNALSGTFRFVTGGAPKDKYLISTPTGTIGVRGTAFDFTVGEEGTKVLLFHGAVLLCTKAGKCVTLSGRCDVGQYDLTDSLVIGPTGEISGAARNALRALFPYANNQGDLLGAFRLDNARECLNRSFVGGPDSDPVTVEGDGVQEQRNNF